MLQGKQRCIYVHDSVKIRLEASPEEIESSRGKRYTPNAELSGVKLVHEATDQEVMHRRRFDPRLGWWGLFDAAGTVAQAHPVGGRSYRYDILTSSVSNSLK